MLKRYAIVALVALLGALSCKTRDVKDPQLVTFQAVQGDSPASKTVLQADGSIFWSPGDEINLFYGENGSARFTAGNTEAAAHTSFTGSLDGFLPNGQDAFWAVCPYSAETRFTGSAVGLYVPESQVGMPGSYDPDAFISLARSQDYTLQFYNLCGGIKFSVMHEGIQYVTFHGNRQELLAGQVNVAFNEEGRPVVQEWLEGLSELSLQAPESGFEVGQWYYIAALPATLSAGYTMTFMDAAGGKVAERVVEEPVTIKRSVWGKLTDADYIPEPITAHKYLTLSSRELVMVSLANSEGNAPTLYFSTDTENWEKWDYSELGITPNAPLYLCGSNPDGLSRSEGQYSRFSFSSNSMGGVDVQVSGDLMSLVDKDEDQLTIPSAYCFYRLFYNCSEMVQAPELPATELAPYCYKELFYGCSGLTQAPQELPAETLYEACYDGMFSGCSALVTVPGLSAMELAPYCYRSIFDGCTSIAGEQEVLPAEILAEGCYEHMYRGCTSLSMAPYLAATTLAPSCYYGMFEGCETIEYIAETLEPEELAENCYKEMFKGCSNMYMAPMLPALILEPSCYEGMFYGCTSLESAPELLAPTLQPSCYASMFYGCTGLSYIRCLATNISAEDCTTNWLYGVAGEGEFFKSHRMEDWTSGPSGIPEGWVVEADEEEYLSTSIPTAYRLEDGTPIRLDGLVYAAGTRSFVLGDWDTANFIQVYLGEVSDYTVNVGDEVSVCGQKQTYGGMAELGEVSTLDIYYHAEEMPEVTYQPYEPGAQYSQVQPVQVPGLVLQQSKEDYIFNYLFPIESAEHVSAPVYLYWPAEVYMDLAENYVNLQGFWLFRGDEGFNSAMDNILISGYQQAQAPYTRATIVDILNGTDDTYYLVSGMVSDVVDTDYGNLYITDFSTQNQGRLYIHGLVNVDGAYPKDAQGGWESFGIVLNVDCQVVLLGKRHTDTQATSGSTTELVDAILLLAEELQQ